MHRRNNFAVNTARIALVALPWLLAACGGKEVTQGSNPVDGTGSGSGSGSGSAPGTSSTPTPVAPSAVSGTVGACPSGYAHPNVCCSASPSGASCVAYESPFQACATGSSTYPDPSSCCSLDDPTQCNGGPKTGGVPPTTCDCAVDDPSCACVNPTDAGVTPPGPICGCPDNDPTCNCAADAGVISICSCPDNDPSCACPVDAGPPTPPPISCTYACPPGWYAPDGGAPGTCCTSDGSSGACTGVASSCPVVPGRRGVPVVQPAGGGLRAPRAPRAGKRRKGRLTCAAAPRRLWRHRGCFSQATGPSGGGGFLDPRSRAALVHEARPLHSVHSARVRCGVRERACNGQVSLGGALTPVSQTRS